MIIIVQKQSPRGLYYEFTDFDSGLVRNWYPPKKFRNTELKEAFEIIARSLMYSSSAESRKDNEGTMRSITP